MFKPKYFLVQIKVFIKIYKRVDRALQSALAVGMRLVVLITSPVYCIRPCLELPYNWLTKSKISSHLKYLYNSVYGTGAKWIELLGLDLKCLNKTFQNTVFLQSNLSRSPVFIEM